MRTKASSVTTAKCGPASDSVTSGGEGDSQDDSLPREDHMDCTPDGTIRPIQEKLDVRDGVVDETDRLERRHKALEVSSPDQQVHVFGIADRLRVHAGHPSCDSVAADHGVRNSRFVQGGSSAAGALERRPRRQPSFPRRSLGGRRGSCRVVPVVANRVARGSSGRDGPLLEEQFRYKVRARPPLQTILPWRRRVEYCPGTKALARKYVRLSSLTKRTGQARKPDVRGSLPRRAIAGFVKGRLLIQLAAGRVGGGQCAAGDLDRDGLDVEADPVQGLGGQADLGLSRQLLAAGGVHLHDLVDLGIDFRLPVRPRRPTESKLPIVTMLS